MPDLVNEWRLILGVWFPIIRWSRLSHMLSHGRAGRHVLEGGWCALCGAVYDYEEQRFGRVV